MSLDCLDDLQGCSLTSLNRVFPEGDNPGQLCKNQERGHQLQPRRSCAAVRREDLFLKATRITCSIRQDQTWRKQELHVESLNKCIGELLRQAEEQNLALQDAQYGFVESRRAQVRQIRNMHEMGEIKRPQEQRTDKVLSAKVTRKSRDDSTVHFPTD